MSLAVQNFDDQDDPGTQAATLAVVGLQTGSSTPAGTAWASSPTPQPVMEFEGIPVDHVEIVISGRTVVEATNTPPMHMDDRVRAVGEFRVLGVNHKVNPKDGKLARIVTLAPIMELQTVPWDPTNPNDDGVIRARP